MRRSRLMSLVETIANVNVGLIVAVTTQFFVFPILGLQATFGQNVKLSLLFRGRVDGAEFRPTTVVRGTAITVSESRSLYGWREPEANNYNDNHPHSGLRMRSPREFRRAHQPAEVSG